MDIASWRALYHHLVGIWNYPTLEQVYARTQARAMKASDARYNGYDLETIAFRAWAEDPYVNLLRFHLYFPYGVHGTLGINGTRCAGTIIPYENVGEMLAPPLGGAVQLGSGHGCTISGRCFECNGHIWVRAFTDKDEFDLIVGVEHAREKGFDLEWKPPTMS